MLKNISFGSDPEFFVYNKDRNQIISSIYLVEGDKETPHPLKDGYAILKDNILVEGNVPPTFTGRAFVESILTLKKHIRNYLSAVFTSLDIVEEDSMDIDPVFLTHPDALLFGCSPYLNAWDGETYKANDLSDENFRTAGFHVHIGYEKTKDNHFDNFTINKVIARAFDLFVTIPSYLEHFDARRFVNYGGLGQFRETSYGLECRSLGGYFAKDVYLEWLASNLDKMLEYVSNEDNFNTMTYVEKPELKVMSDGTLSVDLSIYEELELDLTQLLYNVKTFKHADC